MTLEERYNGIQKARATFANAIAIGAIIAGGLNSLAIGRIGAVVAFTLTGLVLHYSALRSLKSMKVSHDE